MGALWFIAGFITGVGVTLAILLRTLARLTREVKFLKESIAGWTSILLRVRSGSEQ